MRCNGWRSSECGSAAIKSDISLKIAHTECILKDKLSTKQHKRDKRLISVHFLLRQTQPRLCSRWSAAALLLWNQHRLEQLSEDDSFHLSCVFHLPTYISTSKERDKGNCTVKAQTSHRSRSGSILFKLMSDSSRIYKRGRPFQWWRSLWRISAFTEKNMALITEDTADSHQKKIF